MWDVCFGAMRRLAVLAIVSALAFGGCGQQTAPHPKPVRERVTLDQGFDTEPHPGTVTSNAAVERVPGR